MNTVFLVLGGTIIATALLFLLLLLRVPLDDKDFWLKSLSGVLATLMFAVGILALISGHFVGKAQQEEIQAQKGKLLDVQKSNIESQRALEAERTTRLELEGSLAPRSLVATNLTLDRLRRLKETPCVIEFMPDAETQRTASQVASILVLAEWKVLGMDRVTDRNLPDGITLDVRREDATMEAWDAARPSIASAHELSEFLEANGLKASSASFVNAWNIESIPLGAIRISVGFKPAPYFDERRVGVEDEKMRQLLEERKIDQKERVEQLRKDWFLPPRAEDVPEFLPKQREQSRHLTEEQKAKFRSTAKRFSYPGFSKIPVLVKCPATNPEACAFADEIVVFLRGEGWPIEGESAIRDDKFPLTLAGIIVKGPGGAEGAASGVLYQGFKDAETEVGFRHTFSASKQEIVPIWVGW